MPADKKKIPSKQQIKGFPPVLLGSQISLYLLLEFALEISHHIQYVVQYSDDQMKNIAIIALLFVSAAIAAPHASEAEVADTLGRIPGLTGSAGTIASVLATDVLMDGTVSIIRDALPVAGIMMIDRSVERDNGWRKKGGS
ncbi:hypothetical protein AMATHDRAFT_6506 [Amanita thiersii Skay4041]|uniref:Uncharacterized protein n=1 Tax=Amanita thiersii Skay4041 TaxID=703135 RepID=A0A2A9NC92_9AGAR|nr:hypothetical protein AMATHDRAFT_6506 [Amanita thiersii Skay4041]